MEYCVYKLYNNDELLYVGKTNNFYKRLYGHTHSKIWANEITHIEVGECKKRIDMDIYEKYYINKLNAKYNQADVYNETPSFTIEDLNFIRYELEDYVKNNKPDPKEIKIGYKNRKKRFRRTDGVKIKPKKKAKKIKKC